MESGNNISEMLEDICRSRGMELECFKLKDMKILPCRSCGACGFKSPGKCVINDDSHDMLRAIAKCSEFVMLTPVRFGGYSSCLKKALDKFMNLGLPTYMVKDGHLLHPPRYGSKSMFIIGVYDGDSSRQEESFEKLAEHNALNMHYKHKVTILKPSDDMEKIKHKIDNLLKVVC